MVPAEARVRAAAVTCYTDRVDRRTSASRSAQYPRKMGPEQVARAFRLRREGRKHAEIAESLGVSRPLVSHVLSGRRKAWMGGGGGG